MAANCSAAALLELLLMYFPGFRDTTVYKGKLVHFYKRAQILIGDLFAAYGKHCKDGDPFLFTDIGNRLRTVSVYALFNALDVS